MADKSKKPGFFGRSFKLFLTIFVVLLVPVVMDQAEVDRETVRMVGRVAAGISIALLLFGMFTKALKMLGIGIFVLITVVVMISEGSLKAPRVTDWFQSR
jgi:Na+/glutamate symporter